ncbi:MAG TPA: hypothetical protein PKW55_05785 [Spirochaetota bacterium]|nr:hypothetical protein [Spirochaetota bacterium]HOM37537.1 hypothetical protein [Spirochaetota bacterium]HPQ49491.1 hypothetical protein [Spirochaetota bacterium]
MKRTLIIVFVFFNVILYSESKFDLKVGASNKTLDDNGYITIVFKPFFKYNDFFVGLNNEFSFKSDSTLKQDDWDNTRAIIEKLYLGYGQKGDKVVLRVASLDNVEFGYGILVNNFRNDVYYPNRIKPGFILKVDYNYAGINSFIDDVYDLDLIGLRGFLRPFNFIKEGVPEYVKNFQIGGFFIFDYDNLDKDSSSDTYYIYKDDPASKTVKFYGFDVFVPFFEEKGVFTGSNFVEYAKLHTGGSGLSFGVTLKFIDIINFKGSVIYSWSGFIPGYFSSFYEVRNIRSSIYDTTISSPDGWNFSLDGWLEFKDLKIGTQTYYTKGDGIIFTFYGTLEPELLKGFFIRIFYAKRDVKGLTETFDITTGKDNILNFFEIGYQITRNAYISIRYVKSFKEIDGFVTNSSLTEIQTNIVF